jgi:iron complex outermembrane receptor protein
MQGVDFSTSYLLPTSSGDWTFGLTGTYYLKYVRSLTPGDVMINRIDFIDNPTRYRLRGRIGWSHGGWRASATANHMPDYRNTNVTPEAEVNAYTTIDTNVSYALEGRSGLLNDITMSVGVRNLFDNDPPYALLGEDQTYDSSGGSPYGRTITVELRKSF